VDAAGDRTGGGAEKAVSLEPAVTAALVRSALYRLLATAFADPTPVHLEALAQGARQVAAAAPAGLRDGLQRLAAATVGADVGDLTAEHVALFQREVRCPPYEGAYGPAQMAGKAALLADIAGFYRAFALEPAAGRPEVEDHICAELEFMSVLALKEGWAIARGDGEGLEVTLAAQRAFLTDHLGRWTGALAARLTATAAPGFYPAAAALLKAWIDADCARLGLAPRPIEGVHEAEASAFACPLVPPANR
jgi:DMSO reductase family type II enzyme chaperone